MKLLFVEDEADIVTLVSLAAEMNPDIDFHVAQSGAEALEKLQQDWFDVMVSDVMMPPPDGPELVRQVKQMPQHDAMRVVFSTAKTAQEDVDELMSLGADGIIRKPFDPMRFFAEVQRITAL